MFVYNYIRKKEIRIKLIMNGTLINYYYICKRKLWLSYNKINLESNSEDVLIGKELHNELNKSKNTEIELDGIKIDKLTDDYVIEIKKSDSNIEAAILQLKYYLYVLDSYGIHRNGKLKIIEKDKSDRDIKIIYNDTIKKEVEDTIQKIEQIINNSTIPTINKDVKKCKKCSYYEFCLI